MSTLSVSVMGRCLTPSERVAVRLSMQRLQLNEPFGELVFWGKIIADKSDYIILKATDTHIEVKKKFYFSNDGGVSVSELPEVDAFVEERAAPYHGMFVGNPSEVLKAQKLGAIDEEEEAEPEEEEDPEARKFTELERLAYNVKQIDEATSIVPKGLYIRNASNDLVRDSTFKGLSSSSASQLKNYEHLRQSSSAENVLALKKREIRAEGSNLDVIVDDVPLHSWSLQVSPSGTHVTLRNLKWPGYQYQLDVGAAANQEGHRPQGQGAYIGTGQYNHDIVFTV